MSARTASGEADSKPDAERVLPTEREIRALHPDEALLVVPNHPGAPLEDEVVVLSGETEYVVNVAVGWCECEDAHYNLAPEERCKHQARAEFALGELPEWVSPDGIDPWFRLLVDEVDDA